MKSNKGKRRIKFQLQSQDARNVSLVGDFNNWDAGSHPMRRNSDGLWEKTVMLAPGRYEYKFQVDGKWRLDTANSQRCRNRFGTENCIMMVDAGK